MARKKAQSPAELAEIRERKLRKQVRFQLYAYSAHYRRVLDRAGVKAEGFDGLTDLEKIPLTTREDLLDGADEFVLRPTKGLIQRWGSSSQVADIFFTKILRGIEESDKALDEEYAPVHSLESTGTSSNPLRIKLTRRDLAVLATQGARTLDVAGVKPTDTILNLLEGAPRGGFWPVWLGGAAMGAEQIAPGFTDPTSSLPLAAKKATVVVAMPEDAMALLESGPGLPSVRTLILGPAPAGAVMRRRLAELSGPHVKIIQTYGFAEGRTIWAQCAQSADEQEIGFHAFPDLEIIESMSTRAPRAARLGEPGEIVFTGLEQRGTALIRYRPGDVAMGGVRFGNCPYCGRVVERIIGPIRRARNLIELKLAGAQTVAVDVELLNDLLTHPALEAWQVEVAKSDGDPRGADEVLVLFSTKNTADPAVVAVELDRQFRSEAGFSPQFVVSDVPEGGVVDLRPIPVGGGQ
ncbi:MAG TPA: hypothetical protein VND22_05805 [Actinomycetota bacterium]|nr:hypothetical protein [Actinomycetota bacterium]